MLFFSVKIMLSSLISSSLIAFFGFLGHQPSEALTPVEYLAWDNTPIFQLPTETDPEVEKIVNQYLQRLSAQGIRGDRTEIWIQSDWAILADVRGTTPASAASLTKIATSLAVLEKWGANHQFETKIYYTGNLQEGVITGDLIIVGGGDPLFVWEEAIALGNFINQKGIKQIQGNLIITDNFTMNFKNDPLESGQLLKQTLNKNNWSAAILRQYNQIPNNPPQPELIITGDVITKEELPPSATLLVTHKSMTLAEILKQMNIYSNNVMSEILAQSLGGAKIVAEMAAKAADFPLEEITIINGSGLGLDNRISPRAACAMLLAIERQLLNSPLSVADIFPLAGRDKTGTMEARNIPDGVAIKTGTLSLVSALAGVIPTEERGQVWFAVINYGYQIPQLRREQDRLLQQLSNHWQFTKPDVKPNPDPDFLGNPTRNLEHDQNNQIKIP
jgi:D-alanyl-D-alanine carboxypeptidase/D-alanyl-D-alanine-endopeptidase (penicillin-binding protein 4)